MCNCPSEEDVFRSIDRFIDENRWQHIAVGFESRDPLERRWVYSIGLAENFGHPELVLVGAWCAQCSRDAVSELGTRVAGGERFDIPTVDPIKLLDGLAHVRPVRRACWDGDWFAMWRRYYASKSDGVPPMHAVQLIVPDAGGRFPWEPGCHPSIAAEQQMTDTSRQSRARRPSGRRKARRDQRHRR